MTQIIKNFDSFINESAINLSNIAEVTPSELHKLIQRLKIGENMFVFTNWAAVEYAIPHMCKAAKEDKYIKINPSIINVDDFDNSNSLPNLPNAEGQLIYVPELERTDKDVLEQLMRIILTDEKNAYVLSINLNDKDNYNSFMKEEIQPSTLDRVDKAVLCK